MNWGIFSLLVVVLFVLGGIAAFFVFLSRRAALGSQVMNQNAGATKSLPHLAN